MTTPQTDTTGPGADRRLALVAERVFDARTGRWAADRVVMVDGGSIVGVAAAAPAGWPVIELPGASLLPGLIDAHTHVLLRNTRSEERV